MKTQTHFISFILSIFFVIHTQWFLIHSELLSALEKYPLDNKEVKVYIVHVQKPLHTKFYQFKDRVSWYKSFLPNTTLHSGKARMIYAYRHAISGFAAWLTAEEVEAMKKIDGFLLAHPEDKFEARTTHSPGYLGLNRWNGLWPDSLMGQGQVIGVIDSGIKPTHPSFRDKKNILPTPPKKWMGKCYWGTPKCNNKLVGATGFKSGQTVSPLDESGHGTHCSSIAAGIFVDDADVLGQAKGTASGMAPYAHLAMYKVTHEHGGDGSDVLKGIDEAIINHVDILSISIGNETLPIDVSPISIASFKAMKDGIVPVACSGNSGPFPSVQDNDSPWLLTVGAGTIDRKVAVTVTLGNGKEYTGLGTFKADPGFTTGQLPLIYPRKFIKTDEAKYCLEGSKIDTLNLVGKIVVCVSGYIPHSNKSDIVRAAGGAGMILMNHPQVYNTLRSDPHNIPTVNINYEDSVEFFTKYLRTDPNATAAISFNGVKIGAKPAPTLGSFSSRGPSLCNGNIIKPDLIAPGVNILGAWPYEVGANPTGNAKTFTFQSGTSMSTPHVAGIVALLRNNHPDWSPAAIKSALMTTAYVIDNEGNPINDDSGEKESVFGIGAGHVDPVAANDPGLIYDIQWPDYIAFLCGSGFTDIQVSAIVRGNIQCATIRNIDSDELNYPSISLMLGSNSHQTIKRRVKNVGDVNSEYTIQFDEPEGVTVKVNTSTLKFSQGIEELGYEVTFGLRSGFIPTVDQYSEGQLAWDSGKYYVRSPIAVKFT